MNNEEQDKNEPTSRKASHRRRLRAVFAADIANFSGRVSVSETRAFGYVSQILTIGRTELERFDAQLLGIPGDGIFALLESASDAVHCALAVQARLAQLADLGGMKMRIGVHAGDVLFEDNTPFGEALAIGARLESLAEPGGILISGTVFEIASPRISATFEPRGTPVLKNIPRRIQTFSVKASGSPAAGDKPDEIISPLDRTMDLASIMASSAGRSATAAAIANTNSPPLIDDPLRQKLVDASAQYLGPLAAVIISRHQANAATLNELVANLAREVPNEREQFEFHALLSRVIRE